MIPKLLLLIRATQVAASDGASSDWFAFLYRGFVIILLSLSSLSNQKANLVLATRACDSIPFLRINCFVRFILVTKDNGGSKAKELNVYRKIFLGRSKIDSKEIPGTCLYAFERHTGSLCSKRIRMLSLSHTHKHTFVLFLSSEM